MTITPRIHAARIAAALLVLGILLEGVFTCFMFYSLGAALVVMISEGIGTVLTGVKFAVAIIAWMLNAGFAAGSAFTLFTCSSEEHLAQAARMNRRSFWLTIALRFVLVQYTFILFSALFLSGVTDVYLISGFAGLILTIVCHLILSFLLRPWNVKKLSAKGFRRFPAIGAAVGAVVVAIEIISVASVLLPVINAQKNITAFHSFEARSFAGETVTQDVLKDKITILNIWETTCGPCKAEMPALESVSQSLEGSNVQIIGACYDTQVSEIITQPHDIAEAQQILDECGVTYLNLQPGEALNAQICGFVVGFPTTVVLDENGNVLELITGMKEEADWAALAQKYMK